MKISEGLRWAAAAIGDGKYEFSCVAVMDSGGRSSDGKTARDYYVELVSQWECYAYMPINQFVQYPNGCDYDSAEAQEARRKAKDLRVLALLFAAEVAESEGL